MSEHNDIVTSDLADFGWREIDQAAELLHAYADTHPEFLGDGVRVWFNRHSDYVFLSDEDFNVGMLRDSRLEQWHVCAECGAEGFADELAHDPGCAEGA